MFSSKRSSFIPHGHDISIIVTRLVNSSCMILINVFQSGAAEVCTPPPPPCLCGFSLGSKRGDFLTFCLESYFEKPSSSHPHSDVHEPCSKRPPQT